MAQLITGNLFKLLYSDDPANNVPVGAGVKEITNLAEMPTLTFKNTQLDFETYDNNYKAVLLSNKDVEPFDITIHYVPDESSTAFLDAMEKSRSEFQAILNYRQTDGTIDYAIVSGAITATSITGSKDDVVNKVYTFTPYNVISELRTVDILEALYEGSYGVGSNGVDVPQYEPVKPDGNSFIKIPADQSDNPIGSDMMGIGLVDSTSICKLAISKTGNLNIFASNASTAWTRILTATQISNQYVPLTRTINGKALSNDVVINSIDVGLGNVTNEKQLVVSKNLSDVPDKPTARTNLNVYSKTEVYNKTEIDNTLSSIDAGNSTKYATKNELTTAVEPLATKTELSDAVAPLATKTELSDAIEPLATKTELTTAVEPLATKTELSDAVAQLATKTEVSESISTAIAPLATKTELSDAVAPLATKTELTTAIAPFATKTELSDATSLLVPKNTTVNGKALSTSITLNSTDTGSLSIANNLSDVADKDISRSNLNAAKKGINSDITSLTAINTPVSVGTPINSNDAATKQYVDNLVSTGTVGPTLNGVMNWGIGHTYWKMSRLGITTSELALDGQLLKRADYPDLWAFAQSLGTVTDAFWLGTDPATNPAAWSQRGRFSSGDGSTTFRLPDLNGVQEGSEKRLFLRGDGGQSGSAGFVNKSAAPNISGELHSHSSGIYIAYQGGGNPPNAFNTSGSSGSAPQPIGGSASSYFNFDASRTSPVYGRYGVTDEIVPSAVMGVYVIRAFGSFSATKTQWQVINNITAEGNTGTVNYGGTVTSQLDVGTNTNAYSANLRLKLVSGNSIQASLECVRAGNVLASANLYSTGVFEAPSFSASRPGANIVQLGGERNNLWLEAAPAGQTNGAWINKINGQWYNDSWMLGGIRSNSTAIAHAQLSINQNGGHYYWGFYPGAGTIGTNYGSLMPAGSDERLKKDIIEVSSGSTERIMKIKPKEFTWIGTSRRDRGFSAQQLREVSDLYTFKSDITDPDSILNVSDRAVMADMISTIQKQQSEIDELKALVQKLLDK